MTRHALRGVTEGVGARAAKVVAVHGGGSAELHSAARDPDGLKFFEPLPADCRVMSTKVREHRDPDLSIRVIHVS